MRNPEVTILIAVYNGEKTLDACFSSIERQTYRHWKIVCVNDASTDQTAEILARWQDHFSPAKLDILTNQKNIGLTKSLNKGLAKIESPYTARIDADDVWRPDKLAKQVAFFHDHSEYGIIGCNYTDQTKTTVKHVSLPETDKAIRHVMVRRNPFAHSCVVFQTELIKQLGGYDESVRYGQDYDLWWRAFPRTKFYNLPEDLCVRSTDEGISIHKQRQQMWQGLKTQRKYIARYNLAIINYTYTLPLLAMVILPDWVKRLKRKLVP